MFVNKIGSEHLEAGINCQDFGFIKGNRKVVCDGCSAGSASEVGVKMFCYMLQEGASRDVAFYKLASLFYDYKALREHCCFTYFDIVELDKQWHLDYCGDGFIIKQLLDGSFEFEKIDCGEYPEYYIYNFISPEHLSMYKDGVSIKTKLYSKDEYKNIGIASDGLRYILGSPLEKEFLTILEKGKESAMKRFINKHNGISLFNLFNGTPPKDIYELLLEFSTTLKDDILIAF